MGSKKGIGQTARAASGPALDTEDVKPPRNPRARHRGLAPGRRLLGHPIGRVRWLGPRLPPPRHDALAAVLHQEGLLHRHRQHGADCWL